jgi:hypothetical protein
MAPGIMDTRPGARRTLIVALLATAALFLISRLHGGQPMDEDFAGYLQAASNILHGAPISDMGVAVLAGEQAQLAYPPVYPLLLVPVVGVWGPSIVAVKAVHVALLLLTLGLVLAGHQRFGFTLGEAAAAVGVFCLLPETLSQINAVGPDILLWLFLVLGLLALEALLEASPEQRIRAAILVGAAVFFAFEARAVGIALLPAAALACVVRDRQRTHWISLAVPGLTFALLWGMQAALYPPVAFTLVAKGAFFDVIGNLKAFYWHLMDPWVNSSWSKPVTLVLFAGSGLAAIGILDGLRRVQAVSWFIAVYFVILIVLPDFNVGIRYLMPILLFLGALAVRGCKIAGAALNLKERWGRAAAMGIMILLMGALSIAHRTDLEAQAYGAFAAPTQELASFLRANTPPGALIATRKPMAVHLFAERRTIRPPEALRSMEKVHAWAATNNVAFLILKKSALRGDNDYTDCPRSPLCTADATPVYQNRDYQVFRLRRD